MDNGDVADIEQFSAQSAARLETATQALKLALDDYVKTVTQLHGGSIDVQKVFEANDVVRREAVRWDDAVGDHTGTFPLAVEDYDDELDDDECEESADAEPESAYEISVVSRWDLEVSDVPALIEAGRAAHRRLRPEESEADACFAIADDGIGQAWYALVHERGEPWYDLPGVFVVGGRRDYIDRGGDQAMSDAEADDDAPMRLPVGELLYGESWQ